jgi:hypothetical protein
MADIYDDDDDYFDDDEFMARLSGPSLGPELEVYEPGGLLGRDHRGLFSMGTIFATGAPGRAASAAVPPRGAPASGVKTSPHRGRPVTAYGTHEMTPGETAVHLPALPKADAATRQAYADDRRSFWQGPDGRDILYAAQGVPVGRTQASIGYFEGKTNPGQAATPSAFLRGPRGERVVADDSRKVLTRTKAVRAYLDGQDAGAWSVPIRESKLSHANAYEISLPEESPRALMTAQSIAKAYGLPDIVHYGGGRAVVTQYDSNRRVPFTPELTRALDAEMRSRLGSQARPVYLDKGYVPHRWQADIGTGAVTQRLLKLLSPTDVEALDKPVVRERVLSRLDQDADFAARLGTSLRRDLQNARRIFVRRGIEGLDAALQRGVLPMMAIGLLLPHLLVAGGNYGDTAAPRKKRRSGRQRGPASKK